MSEQQYKRTVLLVEDNEDHAEITRFHITDHAPDTDVVWINDGAAAIEHISTHNAKSHGVYPWLVLLDIKLPKYDGHEVLERLKADEVLRKIPVVMFTTSNAMSDIETAMVKGANSYVQKPTEAGEFGNVVAKILDYWALNQHGIMVEKMNHDI